MTTALSKMIYQRRLEEGLTQERFGARYSVSGPAIFKFEKGDVSPSFRLWMKMAKDFKLRDTVAVLLWARVKVPPEYRYMIERKGDDVDEASLVYGSAAKRSDWSRIKNRDRLREASLQDPTLPSGLRAFVEDDHIWRIYNPTGSEIKHLRDTFGTLADGSRGKYCEALRILRQFASAKE